MQHLFGDKGNNLKVKIKYSLFPLFFMHKICKVHTRANIPYAVVIVDSKVWISNLKDQLYFQLVKFIKLAVEVIKKRI